MLDLIRRLQGKFAAPAQPVVLLVLRILIGYAFFRAGYGKLGNLEQVEGFFAQLGIPMPGVNAVVVAVVETVVGLALMLGLATRISAAIGFVNLVVALLTAHMAQVKVFFSTPGEFIVAAPVPYMMLFLVFFSVGPGKISVDRLIGLERDE